MTAALALEARGLGGRLGRQRAGPYDVVVEPGEVVCLVGPNGSGKTTAMLLALGLRRHDAGQILIHRRPVSHVEPPTNTGASLLDDGCSPWMTGAQDLQQLVDLRPGDPGPLGAMDLVGLGAAAHQPTGTYSAGMLRRLGLARALLGSPGLLVLDEPSASLDVGATSWLADLLVDRARAGTGVLVASHDQELIEQLGPRLVPVAQCRTS